MVCIFANKALDVVAECSNQIWVAKPKFVLKNILKSSVEHLKLEIQCFLFYGEQCPKKLDGGHLI